MFKNSKIAKGIAVLSTAFLLVSCGQEEKEVDDGLDIQEEVVQDTLVFTEGYEKATAEQIDEFKGFVKDISEKETLTLDQIIYFKTAESVIESDEEREMLENNATLEDGIYRVDTSIANYHFGEGKGRVKFEDYIEGELEPVEYLEYVGEEAYIDTSSTMVSLKGIFEDTLADATELKEGVKEELKSEYEIFEEKYAGMWAKSELEEMAYSPESIQGYFNEILVYANELDESEFKEKDGKVYFEILEDEAIDLEEKLFMENKAIPYLVVGQPLNMVFEYDLETKEFSVIRPIDSKERFSKSIIWEVDAPEIEIDVSEYETIDIYEYQTAYKELLETLTTSIQAADLIQNEDANNEEVEETEVEETEEENTEEE